MIASPTKVEVEIYPDEYLALERLLGLIDAEVIVRRNDRDVREHVSRDDVLIARLLFAALVRQADERGRS